MPDFWTQGLQDRFHQAVEALSRAIGQQCDEVIYPREPLEEASYGHKLRFKHELQLADHFAYLAHSQLGVEAISAACVEEHVDGLVIRVASNHTPTEVTVAGLRDLLGLMRQGCVNSQSRDTLREQIFESVLSLSSTRILQRIQPRGFPMPAYFRGKALGSLWKRLRVVLAKFEPHMASLPRFWGPLTQLARKLERLDGNVDSTVDASSVIPLLKPLIRECAKISHDMQHASLEEQIKVCPRIAHMANDRAIAEIDKLSRYYTLCNDLSRIALSPGYRSLLSRDVRLEILTAYSPLNRRCASKTCFVHAEVQIVLHYERHPPDFPRPRAIGCSKLACYLCDLLIRKVAKYRVSYTHRRLYPQWTIPAARWMSNEQATYFSVIISSMIADISAHTTKARRGVTSQATTRESRIILPLLSEVTTAAPSQAPSSRTIISSTVHPLEATTAAALSDEESDITTPTGGNRGFVNLPAHNSDLVTAVRSSEVESKISVPLGGNEDVNSPDGSETSSSKKLNTDDLPFEERISAKTQRISLLLDSLNLVIDFTPATVCKLIIREAGREGEATEGTAESFNVADIPFGSGLDISRPKNGLRFKLRCPQALVLDIKLV